MNLAVILSLLVPFLASAQVARFRVTETAGLRRFNYPVRASIRADTTELALHENGKPIPAQFTRVDGGRVEVDFNAAHGPWESREYRVERGAGPAAASAISVTQADGRFSVRSGNMQYDVAEDLSGLLREVRNAARPWLSPGSAGLALDGARVVASKAAILKRGPLVVALRFETNAGAVELEFPRSKSWVEVRWSAPRAGSMAADLNLGIEPPALIDFGANDTVYGVLRNQQRFTMTGQPGSWAIHLDDAPYASGKKTIAEGWAHVMDQFRATAAALDGFGRRSADSIETTAGGKLVLRRGAGRAMHFWLHFVPMPVQIGAATSPQSMMAPLRVDFLNP